MIEILWVFGGGALLAGVMAVHRKVLYLGVTLVVLYVGVLELLSLPKPMYMEWRKEKSEIAAFQLVEPTAIYLWLVPAGTTTPRSYRLPWDKEMALELRKLEEQKEKTGGRLIFRYQEGEGEEGRPDLEAPFSDPPPKDG